MMRYRAGALVVALAALPLASCKFRSTATEPKATPEDRKVIGRGVPLVNEAASEESLRTIRGRRAAAWRAVSRMLQPVRIGTAEGLKGFQPDDEATLPMWQTWYDAGEFVEIFKRLYTGLGKEGRQQKRPFCPDAIYESYGIHAAKALKGWTPEKLEQRLGQLKAQQDVRGVPGKGITLFSPGVTTGLLASYTDIMKCAETVKTLARKSAPPSETNFAPCLAREFPNGLETAVPVDAGEYAHCPEVSAKAPAFDYAKSGVAVAVKTEWAVAHRDDVARFRTDAAGLAVALDTGEFPSRGIMPDSELTPDNIYTIRLKPSDREYYLTGMHFAVKEARHWLWITLWWSDDKDSDFGEDRPPEIQAMPGWNHYKMCVTTDYTESDPLGAEELRREYPSLAAALNATGGRDANFSWCSNPFIELGKGNARTNCIGCHQHAGAEDTPDDVFLDDPEDQLNAERRAKYPMDGRAQVRVNFPSDYLWSLSQSPDYFATKIRGKAYEQDLSDK
jgi:hypothetical protein